MLLRFQKAAVRGNYETGNQAFSKRLRFLTIRDATVVIRIAFIDTLIASLLFGAINPLAPYTNPSLLLTIARGIILVVYPPDAQRPRKRRIVIARNHDELLAVRAGLVGFRELPGMHFRLRD